MNPIIIPTYKRVHIQETLNAIHPDLHRHIIFVVRPEEADVMQKLHMYSEVDVLPASVKNIQATRQYIWDKYSKSHDYFFQLDDDIDHFSKVELVNEAGRKFKCTNIGAKQSPRCTSSRATGTAAQQEAMFKRLIAELRKDVGMTSPRPNWIFPSIEDYPRRSNVLVTGFYAFNAKLLRDKNIRFDRWASCGDTDACLQVLAHGIPTTYCSDYFYKIDVLAEHSSIRESVAQDHIELAQAWESFVKPRKTIKTGELGVMASYTYYRKKLFTERPFA